MTNIIIHRYREPTIGDVWQEFAPRVGRTLRLKLRQEKPEKPFKRFSKAEVDILLGITTNKKGNTWQSR